MAATGELHSGHHRPNSVDDVVFFLSADPSQRTSIGQIRAVHRITDAKLTSDSVRSQDDVANNRKKRRACLRRRGRTCLLPPLIIAHFESQRHHHLIPIFMAHITGIDPTAAARTHPFRPSTRRRRPDPITSTSFACCLADEFTARKPFACIASHNEFTARFRHCHGITIISSTLARSTSAWHDHSSATPTTDVCIDDAAFATVTHR
ncbi:hypothetical protein ACLOJK_015285 [Asimina triloba]